MRADLRTLVGSGRSDDLLSVGCFHREVLNVYESDILIFTESKWLSARTRRGKLNFPSSSCNTRAPGYVTEYSLLRTDIRCMTYLVT